MADDAPTYALHPLTLEVYRVPASSLLHDERRPVFMRYDAFEQQAAIGQLSGERLVQSGTTGWSYDANQVLAVRLRQHGSSVGGRPLYAWASRLKTVLPMEVVRDVNNSAVGGEFLWLWPPGKAYNAYHTRREARRLDSTQLPLPIDEIEPSCRHTMSTPGSMFGPDDIEGATPVPLSVLTPEQRYFLMCIKPQQTLFPRRPESVVWTERVSHLTDEEQRDARQGRLWSDANELQRLRDIVASRPSTPPRSEDTLMVPKTTPEDKRRCVLGKRKVGATDPPAIAPALRVRESYKDDPLFRNLFGV
jgi:hypothetical protein